MSSRLPYFLLALFAAIGLAVAAYFSTESAGSAADFFEKVASSPSALVDEPGVRRTPPTRPDEVPEQAWTGLRIPRPEPADASGLLAREGHDALGRVATTPDVVGLLGWLDAGRYGSLDAALARMSDEALAEPSKEHWGRLGFGAFATEDPGTEALLDAWVAETGSWQAHLARGVYLASLGYARRGSDTIDQTSEAQLRGMEEAFSRASADLAIVRARRPNEVVAHDTRIEMLMSSGDVDAARATYDEAAALCSHCLGPRLSYAMTLLPRWGGSVEAFEDFVRAEGERPGAPPHFVVMRGMPAWRECYQRELQEAFDDALAHCDRAVAVVPYEMFLRLRMRLHRRAERHELAARDAEAILAMTPFSVEGQLGAFDGAARARDYVRAAEHFRIAAWVSPLEDRLRRNLPMMVEGLHWQASNAAAAGDAEVVARANALGEQLAPGTFGANAPSTHLLAAHDAVREQPLDFDAVLALDRSLAPRRQWAPILAAWDRFIAANPDHAEAHLERGGTNFQMGRLVEAERDARRACELGLPEGCRRAEQVARRRAR
jgi:tetratricopeptide (TPR) repeat protein